MIANHLKPAVLALSLAAAGLGNAVSAAEPGEEVISLVLASGIAPPTDAPPRGDESAGPFERPGISGGNLIDGTGAPTQGPVDIIIENDRIVGISGAGTASLAPGASRYGNDVQVIDARGQYAIPGFVDAHVHLGSPTHAQGGALTDPEYVSKLWLAHGVPMAREVGSLMGLEWTMKHRDQIGRAHV